VNRAARQLGLKGGGVAVRSSATLEDLEGLSFAGQYATVLNVRDEAALMEAVETCWQAADQEGVLDYLSHGDLQGQKPRMGVVIQSMVQAAFAGVVFSRHPVAGHKGGMVVEAVPGSGENLVSGKETPVSARVARTGKILERSASSGGVHPPEHIWSRLAGMALLVEELFGGQPLDMEWALDSRDVLWLLQARPITSGRLETGKVPAGDWTRKVADDLWADRLTPFLAEHMVQTSSRFDLTPTAKRLRIAVPRPTLTVIDGFLYLNCHSLAAVLRLLPRRFWTRPVRSLFPPGFDLESLEGPSFGRLALLCLRAAWLSIRVPRSHPMLSFALTRSWLKRFRSRVGELEVRSGSDPIRTLEQVDMLLGLLSELQERNQFPYMYATVLTWGLHWLTVERGRMEESAFWSRLSAGADNVTVTMEREFEELAGLLRGDDHLRRLVRDHGPEDVLDRLPDRFRSCFNDFVHRYGSRARHRTLLVERWQEAPAEVLGLLAQTAGGGGGNLPAGLSRQRPDKGSPFRHPLFALARTYLDLREDLRFCLDRVLATLRLRLLELGRQSGLGNRVFYLTREEISQVAHARMPLKQALDMAGGREASFRRPARPARFVVDGRPVDGGDSTRKTLSGTGTSPGRIQGRARIVKEPSTADLRQGDILIAEHTDPGWTPLLRLVGAVVTEEGGMLNHCSIVARELGIPAVVGIEGATRRIGEGALVTVDGSAGAVHIVNEPNDAAG
jgi:pyruvate,water dikinase